MKKVRLKKLDQSNVVI